MKEGNLDMAEKLFEQSLESRKKKANGSEDKYTLDVLNHLGALKVLKGEYAAAESLRLRVLAGMEKQYSLSYLSTQYIYSNLGLCYLESGQLEKADDMFNRAVPYLESGWGPANSWTLTVYHNQRLLYLRREK